MPVWPNGKKNSGGWAEQGKPRRVGRAHGSLERPDPPDRTGLRTQWGLRGWKLFPARWRPKNLYQQQINFAGSSIKRRLPVLLALLWLSPTAQAEFKITDVQSRFAGGALVVNGKIDFGLTPKVEEALSKGIELSMVIEARLYRRRPWLWDQRLAIRSLRRNLQYHALSGQYLVASGNTRDNFRALGEALKSLGTLSELRLALPEVEVASDEDYIVRLRAHLDIEALPPPLRPVAYTTLSWHLNSGWTTWNVAH